MGAAMGLLRPRLRVRWLALLGLLVIGFLYYRPLHSYLTTRAEVAKRRAEVRSLRTKGAELQRRVQLVESGQDVLRQARKLGFVKPGERLFIIKGTAAWRKAQAAARKAQK
jgi:cell division protein FtsB